MNLYYHRDYRERIVSFIGGSTVYGAYYKINGVNVLSRLSKIVWSRKHTDTESAPAVAVKINMN